MADLDTALARLDEIEPPLTWDAIETREASPLPQNWCVEQPHGVFHAPVWGRRVWLVAAAAAVVVVAIAVVAIVAREDDSGDTMIVGPPPEQTTTVPTSVPAVVPIGDEPWVFPVAVDADGLYLVWSGEVGGEDGRRNDGLAFDPGSGLMTPIPPAPIGPRSEAVGVWTGNELIVCCGSAVGAGAVTADAGAYDPDDGTWRRLADPPAEAARGFGVAEWTGTEMIVVGGTAEFLGLPPIALAYDPVADSWRRLADPPESVGRIPESAWTGSELLLWSRSWTGGDAGYRYDPAADRWSPIDPLAPDRQIEYGSAAWTGSELIVYGLSVADETRAVANAWSPAAGSWRALPDPPTRPIDWYEGTLGSQSLVWNDVAEMLVVWPTHGGEYGADETGTGPVPLLGFDPTTGSWTQLTDASLGYHPQLTSIGRFVLRPDPSNPIVLAFDVTDGPTTQPTQSPLSGQLVDGRPWRVWDD